MAAKTAADAVRQYLKRLEPGTVFTPAELVHARLGSEDAVRQTLRRLATTGDVRRLSKGYYDVPRVSPRIGVLSPTPEAIIAAHERKTGATIERPELEAANKLGLTTQVVARPIYRTNLFSRELKIGGQRIRLRTSGPRSLARDDDPSELVIDALSTIGKANITDIEIAKLRAFVREHKLGKKLLQRSKRAPAWMLPVIDSILAKSEGADG
ncbi:MAG TPA: DUF6088 family protein [Candidatus Baltobacteraceae bacterium]|nr:DUF6088 family protein [Candidatus Baltobacteraceae bacterium]